MSYGLLDDGLWRNRKTATFTDEEHRLWINSISWCRDNRDTRGVVTFADLQAIAARYGSVSVRRLRTIVAGVLHKRGFDQQEGDAYLVHDYRPTYKKDEALSANGQAAAHRRWERHAEGNANGIRKGMRLASTTGSSRAGPRQDPSPPPVPDPLSGRGGPG